MAPPLHLPALPSDRPGRLMWTAAGLYRLVAVYPRVTPGFGSHPWTVWVHVPQSNP